MARALKTAFIVLTYNRPDTLVQVLKSLALQCGAGHEVLIADDGSSPQSVAQMTASLPTFQCPVRHVWHPDVGFTASRARNLAAAASASDYLVFMDGDCIPNPRFAQAHAALAQDGCFVNGSRVLLSQRLASKIVANELDVTRLRWQNWFKFRLQGDASKCLHLMYWPSAPGRFEELFRWKKIRSCNFALWKSDFMRVNGFDETFEGWGHEDADLVLRLHHAGLTRKNGFLATEVYHLWHPENSRHNEVDNRQRVVQRMSQGLIRASQGVSDNAHAADVRVTQLN